MKKNLFDSIFEDTNELFEEFEKTCKKAFGDEESNEDYEKNGYYHFLSDKYKDGECVEHNEKIVDNGKVIKNEHNGKDMMIEKRTIGSEVIKAKNTEIEKLKAEVEELKKENQALKAKIAKIKNLFS